MADSLFVLALTGLCISVLRLLVFAYLWRRESSDHLRLWTLGFMVQIFAQVCTLPAFFGYNVVPLQALGMACLFGTTVLLLLGTWRLLGRRPDWRWWGGGLAGVIAASMVVEAGGSMVLASIVPVLFLAFAYLSMGVALFQRRREMSGLGVGLTIFSLGAIGLHFIDYPFLAEVQWFVPWGLGLALFNDIALTIGLVVLGFDRTYAARALADARYSELASTLGVGTFAAATKHFSEVNGALVRMLGYESEAELKAVDLSTELFHAPGKQLDLDALTEPNATWRKKDGAPLLVQLHSRTIRDAQGKTVACRGFVVDRTEAHAIEEALSRTQKLDAVGRLAGGVAHDFNNLLTIIHTNLELLALKPSDPSPLNDALEATEQAAQLIRRLLAFGRKQGHHVESVDIGASTLRTAEMLGRSLGTRHRLDTSAVGSKLWAHMDAGQLEQVVVNLVLNAKDAMANGGVIRVSARAQTRAGRSGVELAVKDTGHGMKPEDKARIFEPFFTTREPGRGTGLGLSTVHGIVTQAGGQIEVESTVGRGTSFTLWFPDTPAPATDTSAQKTPTTPPGKRVLVVDDEPAIRRTVCRMLEAAGHVTCEASSGNQAIALVTSGERFDVMLSDVRMADGDGPTAALRVRAIAPTTRVVLMSGFQDAVDQGTQEGVDAFLAKPFTRGVLLAAIEGETVLRAAS